MYITKIHTSILIVIYLYAIETRFYDKRAEHGRDFYSIKYNTTGVFGFVTIMKYNVRDKTVFIK